MTVGLPGAGIGGLFYLASTILLPVRSFVRRVRGQPDPVGRRQHSHSLFTALGIVAALWLTGWLLAFVVPVEIRSAASVGSGSATARTVLPIATFGIGVATLVVVLLVVEVANRVIVPRRSLLSARLTRGEP